MWSDRDDKIISDLTEWPFGYDVSDLTKNGERLPMSRCLFVWAFGTTLNRTTFKDYLITFKLYNNNWLSTDVWVKHVTKELDNLQCLNLSPEWSFWGYGITFYRQQAGPVPGGRCSKFCRPWRRRTGTKSGGEASCCQLRSHLYLMM